MKSVRFWTVPIWLHHTVCMYVNDYLPRLDHRWRVSPSIGIPTETIINSSKQCMESINGSYLDYMCSIGIHNNISKIVNSPFNKTNNLIIKFQSTILFIPVSKWKGLWIIHQISKGKINVRIWNTYCAEIMHHCTSLETSTFYVKGEKCD